MGRPVQPQVMIWLEGLPHATDLMTAARPRATARAAGHDVLALAAEDSSESVARPRLAARGQEAFAIPFVHAEKRSAASLAHSFITFSASPHCH